MARLLPADPGVPAPPSPPTPPSGEPRPDEARAPEAGTPAPPAGRQPGEAPAIDEWLVDGFNLLHAVLLGGEERSRWWTREMRMRVLREVAAVRAATDGAPAIVVFDGSGEPGPDEAAHGPGVRVVFAKPADAWLIARVRSARHPERIALVSADRQLASRARHRGARIVSPREFLGRGARA